ncbi:AMP-binding enzyme [Nocardia fusca]|uniref:AMP-binding enzyme n=1 Tax=Nocardia fusca TaxID=941183 RepID=UPI0007A7640D|nr:hypothetical protein [Nocardia fusca]
MLPWNPRHAYGQRIRAFVARTEHSTLEADDIRAYVKLTLARYKVPRDIVFVDTLPRNSTGKILTRDLNL